MLTSAINGAREETDILKTVLGQDCRIHLNGDGFRTEKCLSRNARSFSVEIQAMEAGKTGCGLPNTKMCPKASLNQLTFREIQLMGDFVTSEEYAHFPIRSLHYSVKRKGLLFVLIPPG
ncbi:MAG TPA: hypothetical protein DCS07_14765 [Bdellovibrionales bacterium]|nr:MAG: hypothetical protein A2Z97_13950 [Bdellovibrionales bacterium GWB1_52_6]OFZ06404.1 MAG: hypothetical protein A2X97_03000 [Bdellovibrionales bacterium GWA1_52_35]OFZ39948.1 MAG: hypothetical protein A2070_07845 [Bdellovibrionales bacterium GWC1_52_8]HAR43872.1 hypothetical protein [Bdellovibrionales bacterium]HCM40161.1 hypothetical protein [Bdellovibrionales bacterium]